MIVRNEAGVIERCLNSARPAIDAAVVCDTGSGDGTAAIVQSWLRRENLPGRVYRHEFRDFAHNRTLAIAAAREAVEALGWDTATSYLLFLDADMVLRIDPRFRREALAADIYLVVQRNGSIEYPNVRLARASLKARFVGATHEYFKAPPGASESLLDTLVIDDRNDGGSRADKYERDRRLLEEELRSDPGNARAMFYLGQTYWGMGEAPKALLWYRRRVVAGGWREEMWAAQLAIGRILAEAGDPREAARALIQAIRIHPERPETFFHLAYVLRSLGHYRAAFRCARTGLAAGLPHERSLFLDREVCDWGLLREVSINGFYMPGSSDGFEANERLELGRGAPADYSALAASNAIFYAEPLAGAVYSSVAPELPPPFAPCNPSLLRTDEGYLLNCRAVSYRLDPYQRYSALEPDGIFRTKNFLIRTDRNVRFLSQTEVRSEARPVRQWQVSGLEDVRLFNRGGKIGFTCTTADLHPDGGIRVSLFPLADNGDAEPHVPLSGFGGDLPQKNWLPFEDAATGELRAIYGYEPTVVLGLDPESGHATPVVRRSQGRNLEHLRGSAGPLDLPSEAGGGRLVIVHQVAFHGRRYYMHRFLRFDEDWSLVEASRPFFFLHRGIEFACGTALAHGHEDLLITFGVEDREAWLCRIPLRAVTEMLRPLPAWPPHFESRVRAS